MPEMMRESALGELADMQILLNVEYYTAQLPAPTPAAEDMVGHFLHEGDRALLAPNWLFDPEWYVRTHLGGQSQEGPFRHYVTVGERLGLRPSPLFSPDWYARRYGIDRETRSALAHYLAHSRRNAVSPNPWFDVDYYLQQNPDVAQAGVDGFHHWYHVGVLEGRRGSPEFDAAFVRSRYLGPSATTHPFRAFLDRGLAAGWRPRAEASASNQHAQIRYHSAPGPYFEELGPPLQGSPLAQVLAFYLPQFHAIPENDRWWGTGFTEWRNLARGTPRYRGHYQPRVPRDLGFYELSGTAMLRRQAELAKRMGVTGFCFYYYNFGGHRLLESPVEAFLADPVVDMPFCLMWANENWTRRWDGEDSQVLIGQDFTDAHMDALVDDVARHMADPRYIRLADGRPVLFVYRADQIPDCRHVLDRWRAAFRSRHGLSPWLIMAQSFGNNDPRPFGFDAAVEFPPHKLGSELPEVNGAHVILDPAFTGSIRNYDDAVASAEALGPVEFPLIRTAFPMWDNDARRQGTGMIFHDPTPAAFERWMAANIAFARAHPVGGSAIVCVNAWNEWCEGAYLEPDCHFGYAFLNALRRSLRAPRAAPVGQPAHILLVGHDAFPAGAQQLLLAIAGTLQLQHGIEVAFLLLGGGALLDRYRAVGETFVFDGAATGAALDEFLGSLERRGFAHAIANTVFTGGMTRTLAERGHRVISLVHELPAVIAERWGAEHYAQLCTHSAAVVFPAETVRRETCDAYGLPSGRSIIRPQGLYTSQQVPPDAHAMLRRRLGLPSAARIVINCGYGDPRKGVDIFLATADRVLSAAPDVHFLWVGDLDPTIGTWVKRDLGRRFAGRVHHQPFVPDAMSWMAGADAFFLSSREDPFPSVVLEALAVGLPVVAFAEAGGAADLLATGGLGEVVPYLDIDAAAAALRRVLDTPAALRTEAGLRRRRTIARDFDFANYCADLMRLVGQREQRVSVILPNYNYAHYLRERLQNIRRQTFPIHEIILLDDASTDSSRAVIDDIVAQSGNAVRAVFNSANSGSVFRQWKRGLDLAAGDLIWIAEADDLARPDFLERLVACHLAEDDTVFTFCDSVAIDAEGNLAFENYKSYYAEYGDHALSRDGSFRTLDFLRRFLAARNLVVNASAVLWSASALRAAFARLGEEAFALRCAGDWRLYLEACRVPGRIGYLAEPLNSHRRHDNSVTDSLDKAEHVAEIVVVQNAAREIFPQDDRLHQQCDHVVEDRRRIWGLDAPTDGWAGDEVTDAPDGAPQLRRVKLEELYGEIDGYRHLDVSVFQLRHAGQAWHHVRFKLCWDGSTRFLEFRRMPGWPTMFLDWPGVVRDEFGELFRLSLTDPSRPPCQGRDAALLAAIAQSLARIVALGTESPHLDQALAATWRADAALYEREACAALGLPADMPA